MISFTQGVGEFQNNALWDTLEHALFEIDWFKSDIRTQNY